MYYLVRTSMDGKREIIADAPNYAQLEQIVKTEVVLKGAGGLSVGVMVPLEFDINLKINSLYLKNAEYTLKELVKTEEKENGDEI